MALLVLLARTARAWLVAADLDAFALERLCRRGSGFGLLLSGRRLIEVVAGLDSWNARVQESTRLMEWGFNAWQAKPLFKSGQQVGSAQVQLGSEAEVPLLAPRDLAVTVPAGLASGPVRMKVRYQGPLAAPIAKGQEVAQLVITTGDTGEQIVPLVAGADVGRAGFFGRIWLGLKQLVGMA